MTPWQMRSWRGLLVFLFIGWTGIEVVLGEVESVRSVQVHAEAEELSPISRAVVAFVLISEGKTPGDAERKDQARFEEIRKKVDTEWGGKATWRPSEIRLQPVMVEEKGRKEGKERIVAYRISRREEIEIAEFSQLGGLLAALLAAGVDEVNGVEWISDGLESLYRKLLGKAMEKAREKAEVLAKATGAQLGPILTIHEGGEPVRPIARFEAAAMGALARERNPLVAVPVSGGEIRIRAAVQAVYRLW